jgi:hypothetical protein
VAENKVSLHSNDYISGATGDVWKEKEPNESLFILLCNDIYFYCHANNRNGRNAIPKKKNVRKKSSPALSRRLRCYMNRDNFFERLNLFGRPFRPFVWLAWP